MSTPLLQAKEVKIWIGSENQQKIVEIIKWEVRKGEVWLIIGGNGSGKTTLLRGITGLIPNVFKGHIDGELLLFGKPSHADFPSAFRQTAFLFQNPYDQITQATVQGEIDFPLENLGYPRSKGIRKREGVIEQFELQKKRNQHPTSLSTGEGQKVLIASIVARDSSLICLDEPLSFIDFSERKRVLRWIKDQCKQRKSFIIATHRPEEYIFLKPKLLLLDKGKGLIFDNMEAFFNRANWEQVNRLSLVTQYNFIRQRLGKAYRWNLLSELMPRWQKK